jgi:thioredoxin
MPVTHADDTTFADEVLAAPVPVVVDFHATWCGPCHVVGPEIERLAEEHGGAVKVVKVDVDRAPAVARHYGVQGVPTIALFRGGELAARSVGAKPRRAIEAELGLGAPVPTS